MIIFVWAQDRAGNIGKANKMPWYLPGDLQFFKKTTTGKTLVMGRKTYESLGKALPNRKTIVLTRDKELHLSDAEVLHSRDEVLDLANTGEPIYVVGGAEIYRLFIDVADKLIVTKIEAEFDADTAFPEVDWENFSEVAKETHEKDEKNKYNYTFYTYERN
ncbi:dihydrofolate reductase [Listeria ivanovii]|uniref:Dihydrofolate reductase n=2 Tax=Listeria ivanovii TaxID=1638 RepID=A0ABS1G3C0_LISIV|nr:dihydrofolate reductase [Listeria ivanovii]AIS60279.1 dihydrofolate reductase [Listeria ivanovii subsp. londoniensis]AIS63105.1 dihydrofolate reductase [Listeria ivanovii subsp. londoniensis]MBK1961371.1 dihydrofolate reductase [Listeria ivanovii subsp. londoniensis]MBK1966677.1 dihydrofolate reductase [Listeria ivanovii subsp. londoniensis]MBK1984136.1 dihydrofolate reductase [Listeria ivanovii subsp. londoniensis]